jgi:hypothetical protein
VGKPSLEGVDLKLKQAQEHLFALAASVVAFLRDPDTYGLAVETDGRRGPILRVEHARNPPPDWGVIIGECVYDFHSALDHLAFQLAVANTRGRALPKSVAESSAFPIFNSGPKFRAANRGGRPTPASGLRKIVGTSANAQAIIEQLQPYHRKRNPGARSLWQLHELSNIDKHRLLHVTHSSLEGSEFRLSSTDPVTFRGYEFTPGPLKSGAVIARWNLDPLPGEALKVQIDANLITDVTFAKSSPARSVRGAGVLMTLNGIGTFIAQAVLPPLAAELGLTSSFRPGRLIDVFTASEEDMREALDLYPMDG